MLPFGAWFENGAPTQAFHHWADNVNSSLSLLSDQASAAEDNAENAPTQSTPVVSVLDLLQAVAANQVALEQLEEDVAAAALDANNRGSCAYARKDRSENNDDTYSHNLATQEIVYNIDHGGYGTAQGRFRDKVLDDNTVDVYSNQPSASESSRSVHFLAYYAPQ